MSTDLTNRAIIIGSALVAMFVVLVIVLLAWGAPDESIDRLADLSGYMRDHNNREAQLIVTFGGLILVLLAAILIVFEVSPPESGSVKVQKVGTGEARIGTDEVGERVVREVRALPDVNDADVTVSARGDRAEVRMELHVEPEADLSGVADEACRRARNLIEGQMGVELVGPPQARLHYRELRVSRPAPAKQPAVSRPEPAPRSSAPPTQPTGFTGWERLPTGPSGEAIASGQERPSTPSETGRSEATSADEATEKPQEERPAST